MRRSDHRLQGIAVCHCALGLGLGGGGNAGCLSADEEVVCISENDACGVDAIQVILGCSIGKGNLLFHMRGKQAFTFFDRKSGKSLRLVLKPKPEGMTRQESFAYYQSCAPKDMFQVTEAKIQLPEKARIFDSYVCDCCGESTGANWIRLAGEKSSAWIATRPITVLMYNRVRGSA